MDGRRNVLGIIALALGALALMVSLGGRSEPRFAVNIDGYGARAETVPNVVRPNENATERDATRRSERFDGRGGPPWMHGESSAWAGDHAVDGPPWARGDRHFGPGPFFPFMILGGLLKLLFAGALIMFGLRLFRGRGGRGGWGGPGRWRGRPAVHEPMPGDHRRHATHTPENNYL